ncbi:PREDICTED: feather beta keratin-like [Ficedula albicollis]|uniref:feather beta keratin-like n=1 Tax=Ficedula albicollis TaxID=59894 RepID=UPI000359A02F|nr:PREDICTED: feather beta keratin-like [Ficedula albicollis]
MACYDLCRPCGPTPLANSCNEPCALQCQDSRVIINPSPVLVTLPGPIMTSFPQSTAVGSTSSAAVGTELSVQGQPISGGFGGFGYGLGYGRGFGYGALSSPLLPGTDYISQRAKRQCPVTEAEEAERSRTFTGAKRTESSEAELSRAPNELTRVTPNPAEPPESRE